MQVKIDFEKLQNQVKAWPAELATLDDAAEEQRPFYEEKGGTFVLDAKKRDELVTQLGEAHKRTTLAAENTKLKEQNKQSKVVAAVRESLAKVGVNPSLLDAATALFISRHNFALDEDGTVIVVGEYHSGEAEMAAVRFVEANEALREEPDTAFGIKSALRSLH